MSLLADILASKQDEIKRLRQAKFSFSYEPRKLTLGRTGSLELITEIKLKSPSAGPLSTVLSVSGRAAAYSNAGAQMLSILCDAPFFGGSFEHLKQAREACDVPLLCKDFIIDESQLDAAVAHGADAVLLIVRCLSETQLSGLVQACADRKLTPLVEVFTKLEQQAATSAGAEYVGVNARNLDTLKVDTAQAHHVMDSLADDCVGVHLSGIKTPADITRVRRSKARAALIGETLMQQDDPTELLQSLVDAAQA